MRRLGIVCIDQILVKFGKTDVDAVANTTELISSAHCLDVNNLEIGSVAMVALTTVAEILMDEFARFVPATLPEAMTFWTTTIEKDTCTHLLNNATHSFFGAILLYVPWAISDSNLDRLLEALHMSANVQIDEVYSLARRATLSLVAKHVDPKECCDTLERTWTSAMAKGPLVRTTRYTS